MARTAWTLRSAPVVLAASFSIGDALTKRRFEPAAASAIVLLLWWYLSAVKRLLIRGRRWTPQRLACFLTGVAVLAVATQSGIAAGDTTSFSDHVIQHLLL